VHNAKGLLSFFLSFLNFCRIASRGTHIYKPDFFFCFVFLPSTTFVFTSELCKKTSKECFKRENHQKRHPAASQDLPADISSEPDQRREVDKQFLTVLSLRELNGIEPTLSIREAQVKAGDFKQFLNDRDGDGGVGAGVREEGGPVISAIIHNRVPDLLRGPEDGEELVDHCQNDGEALFAQAVV
jgi:hypothetical protein